MQDVFVNTRTLVYPNGVAVPNVFVALHSALGAYITSGTTDVNGSVFLGNRASATYEIRVTPPTGSTVAAGALQKIVVSGDVAQTFDVLVETAGLPVAQDATMCRCSGYFVTSHNAPAAGLSIHFQEGTLPVLLTTGSVSRAVVPVSQVVKTDSKGYAVIDLIRKQTYSVLVEGYDDVFRSVLVPDQSSSTLPDVLFPVINHVEYKDGVNVLSPTAAPTISLAKSVEKTLKVTTVFRSGIRVAGAAPGVVADLADNNFVSATLTGDTLVLKTKDQSGQAEIKVSVNAETQANVPVFPAATCGGTLTISVV